MRRNFFEHRGHFCFRISLISSHWHQSKGGTFFALFIYLFFFLFKLHKIILPFIFNSRTLFQAQMYFNIFTYSIIHLLFRFLFLFRDILGYLVLFLWYFYFLFILFFILRFILFLLFFFFKMNSPQSSVITFHFDFSSSFALYSLVSLWFVLMFRQL